MKKTIIIVLLTVAIVSYIRSFAVQYATDLKDKRQAEIELILSDGRVR